MLEEKGRRTSRMRGKSENGWKVSSITLWPLAISSDPKRPRVSQRPDTEVQKDPISVLISDSRDGRYAIRYEFLKRTEEFNGSSADASDSLTGVSLTN